MYTDFGTYMMILYSEFLFYQLNLNKYWVGVITNGLMLCYDYFHEYLP